jgi:hypothetical protein
MLPLDLKQQITKDDLKFKDIDPNGCILPRYDPGTHYFELTKSGYFRTLIFLRHYMKIASDYYFGVECGAKDIDLFM